MYNKDGGALSLINKTRLVQLPHSTCTIRMVGLFPKLDWEMALKTHRSVIHYRRVFTVPDSES